MLTYNFPAVKGVQAKAEYFICMVPLGLLKKIFSTDYNDVPPEYRAQRRLNEARIPEIRDYILDNRDSYVFSALTAAVDGEMVFHSTGAANVGVLEIDMNATFLISDGQHRKAAINEALEEDSSLAEETISLVLFRDKGLQRSQQMFTDLNKHAVVTSKSLNTLYESKDPVAIITKHVVNGIPFLKKYTDKEKDNLGKYSSNLFTLNNFYRANLKILSGAEGNLEEQQSFVLQYWKLVSENMREWNELERGEISKKALRENYIATQGITLQALGKLGGFFYSNPHLDMASALQGLRSVNWLRNNTECWENRAIKQNGSISKSEKGILLTYIEIKRLLSLPITAEETMREKQEVPHELH